MGERTQADYKQLAADFQRVTEIVQMWGEGGHLSALRAGEQSGLAVSNVDSALPAIKTAEGRVYIGHLKEMFGLTAVAGGQPLAPVMDLPDTDQLQVTDERAIKPLALRKFTENLHTLAAQGEPGVKPLSVVDRMMVDGVLDGFATEAAKPAASSPKP